jgi:hypothetical protein
VKASSHVSALHRACLVSLMRYVPEGGVENGTGHDPIAGDGRCSTVPQLVDWLALGCANDETSSRFDRQQNSPFADRDDRVVGMCHSCLCCIMDGRASGKVEQC